MKSLYGVIGSPIAHSMSPLIHNDAFLQKGVDAYYHAFHVDPEELETAVAGMRALGVNGFNVTIPHKEAIIPLLDRVEDAALQIGAVNTVVNRNGELIGYNTDGRGFVEALKEVVKLKDKHVLIIGAGGAARAIFYTLALEEGVQIDICNRTVSKAEDLIKEFSLERIARSITVDQAAREIKRYDVVVQTTSVGMHPKINDIPLPLKSIKHHAVFSDIIYNPIETKLLQEAKSIGAITQNGIHMFAYQAALAFEIWTGKFPDTVRMKKLVEEHLGGKTC
ncbi:shikimate dehydrogenase [Sutcliffiella horikoshii]|uniref:Shikimate dehydrogenase (NADP(+)) n=1 Tax=Sutcliffiella horikoshii TaxID=79883 RepID=A0AA94WQY0_9BACI|nr:shikimate dehydrogenase [Sutcliffiella horikoshii]TYS59192.1 shikimate dehydrogenase [Sutcliffiella horikoshii]